MHDEDLLWEAAEQHQHPLEAHATDQVEAAVRSILEGVGEDPDRDGLKNTPAAWRACTKSCCWGITPIRLR